MKLLNLLFLSAAVMAQSRLIQFTEMLEWPLNVRFTKVLIERNWSSSRWMKKTSDSYLKHSAIPRSAVAPEKRDQVRAGSGKRNAEIVARDA